MIVDMYQMIILIMIKNLLKVGNILRGKTAFKMGSKKIGDVLEEYSDKITQEPVWRDEKQEQILRNYMELTQESYLQHLIKDSKELSEKSSKIDPSILLMILPTLQKEDAIREHLMMLFPHVPLMKAKQLLLFYQFVLAYKLKNKPKIPLPKPIKQSQGLLVILAELYPKDYLIEWLKQVPLYDGQSVYLVAMGAFSIISGLSQRVKAINKKLVDRCLQRIIDLFRGQDSQSRSGIILLALESRLKVVQQLLFMPFAIDIKQIDGIKISLLIIQLDCYIKDQYNNVSSKNPINQRQYGFEEDVEIDEGIDKKQENIGKEIKKWREYVYDPQDLEVIKFKLEEFLMKLVANFVRHDWKMAVKLHTLVKLFQVIKGKKLEKIWFKFSEKLFNYTLNKEQISLLSNLSTSQIVGMLEVIETLKINKPQLLKNLLVVISQRLQTADKNDLIRLSKCLVTYVRVCQDYLIHFRTIIQRRKFIFSRQDIDKLNDTFRRVQILFPRPLSY